MDSTTSEIEYRVMRRHDGVRDGEWHVWHVDLSEVGATQRLYTYRTAGGFDGECEYRVEQRTRTVTVTDWVV